MAEQYLVVTEKSIAALIASVNVHLVNGWRVSGGVAIADDRGYAHQSFKYLQAMTRTVDDADE